MTNSFYDEGLDNIGLANVNLVSHTIRVYAVDAADYTIDLNLHDALDDVPAGARVANAALASKTLSDGTFDAADTTLSAVTGDPFELLIIAKDSGVESTSFLLAAIDTGTGLPATPNGGDITIAWNAAGIFSY